MLGVERLLANASELAVALMPRIAVVTSVPQFKIYDMAFTDAVITRYAGLIEKFIWTKAGLRCTCAITGTPG